MGKNFSTVERNPSIMGGKPCLKGTRVTVKTISGLVASGISGEEILELYPYLEPEGVDQTLAYAILEAEEILLSR